jgi:cytoskeletal protein CcmA (bactofilin family)
MATDASHQSIRGAGSLSVSTIGEDLVITGDVRSKGEIHLDGRVQGDVHCTSLVLGENSQLEGSVIAEDVVIRGRLVGSVRALRVMLQSRSHVEADLLHNSLAIEQGAYFEGQSRCCDDPLSPDLEAPVEKTAAKVQREAGRPERHNDKRASFVRSLPESRSADKTMSA